MTTAAPALTETQFQRQVLDLAAVTGWLVYHTFNSKRSAPGFPDLVLVNQKQQRIVYAELKTATGRVTEPQRRWLHALGRCGAEVALWRPADLPEIKAVLLGKRIAKEA